jgi:hypothetical protein
MNACCECSLNECLWRMSSTIIQERSSNNVVLTTQFQQRSSEKICKSPCFFQPNSLLRMLQRTAFIHAVVLEEENVFIVSSGV